MKCLEIPAQTRILGEKNMIERVCLQCGKEIEGRKGKKFCSIECKNRYNNSMTSGIRKFKSIVLDSLSMNYSILDSLIKNGITSIELEGLCSMGFNPEVMTGSSRDKCGHSERKCYDIIYCQSNVKLFNIRRIINPGR